MSIRLQVVEFDRVGSTNDIARNLAAGGAPEGTLVTACEQTTGRGRRGGVWWSPPGNLYMSLILRPECSLSDIAQLSIVAAVAIATAISEIIGSRASVSLKWPNDILVDGAKISGILLETESYDSTATAVAIVGVGINVCHKPEIHEYPTASLAELGIDTSLPSVLNITTNWISHFYEIWKNTGFDFIRSAWLGFIPTSGLLEVRVGDTLIMGEFAGLAPDGSMLLATQGGIDRIVAGDVRLRHLY